MSFAETIRNLITIEKSICDLADDVGKIVDKQAEHHGDIAKLSRVTEQIENLQKEQNELLAKFSRIEGKFEDFSDLKRENRDLRSQLDKLEGRVLGVIDTANIMQQRLQNPPKSIDGNYLPPE